MYESVSASAKRSLIDLKEKHPLIEGHYVDFFNNQYVITISEDEALLKGISKESYKDFKKAVIEANQMLDDIINDCLSRGNNVFVEACLYEDSVINNFIPSVKTRSEVGTENFPRGSIETNGQEYGLASISKIPYNMKYVDCDCRSNSAPLPTQAVVAESFGSSNVKTAIGPHSRIKVMFPASNVPGGIKYRTTDSNGGKCGWVGTSD